jgi:hypothetical protein
MEAAMATETAALRMLGPIKAFDSSSAPTSAWVDYAMCFETMASKLPAWAHKHLNLEAPGSVHVGVHHRWWQELHCVVAVGWS